MSRLNQRMLKRGFRQAAKNVWEKKGGVIIARAKNAFPPFELLFCNGWYGPGTFLFKQIGPVDAAQRINAALRKRRKNDVGTYGRSTP